MSCCAQEGYPLKVTCRDCNGHGWTRRRRVTGWKVRCCNERCCRGHYYVHYHVVDFVG